MEKSISQFEFLEHPAELKIRIYGKDLPEIFINATLAVASYLYPMFQSLSEQDANSDELDQEEIVVESVDLESLLVDWLSEILWRCDTFKRAYVIKQIKDLGDTKICATVNSVPAELIHDIKAVTFHELEVVETKGSYQATVVFDI